MSLAKRIIPCLDIRDGRTVKGVQFGRMRDAGDALELAARYVSEGADELVFLDITATTERRDTLVNLVKEVARRIDIPFTVGGGVRTVDDVAALLNAGADKISINSAAVADPALITAIANRFGAQCVVLAMDIRPVAGVDRVCTHAGTVVTTWEALGWAKAAVEAGAGEILITAIDRDGTGAGFANELTRRVATSVPVPVIASGGAGSADHFRQVFVEGAADAALAAGLFHRQELSIPGLKTYLASQNITVRL